MATSIWGCMQNMQEIFRGAVFGLWICKVRVKLSVLVALHFVNRRVYLPPIIVSSNSILKLNNICIERVVPSAWSFVYTYIDSGRFQRSERFSSGVMSM